MENPGNESVGSLGPSGPAEDPPPPSGTQQDQSSTQSTSESLLDSSNQQQQQRRPPPPLSPLTGCYLLIVIGEPHSDRHKEIILQKIAKAFLSWDVSECHVSLEKELQVITSQSPEGEEARYGERLIQYATENLVTEILIHPQLNTLHQCMKNLLSSFTKHRHIIHAGYTFAGNGSWILQDGTLSISDLVEALHEPEVLRVLKAYENSVSIDVHCAPEGDWATERFQKEPVSKLCSIRINPGDVMTAGNPAISAFIDYLSPFLEPANIQQLLQPTDVVGNIRFTHPTLYVFPGGQGDAALFGINGFNMLIDGGFARKACFWDFARHLDRLDAVLLTRLNNSTVNGISAVLQRKKMNHVYPQIGHFFCNLQDRKIALSPDGDKDKDSLIVNLAEEGQEIVANLRHLALKPHPCYRDGNQVDPVNLYHKVGHGKLDMYVISPARDSQAVKEFLAKWSSNDSHLFSNTGKKVAGKAFEFPLQNLVSICALLVWQPANPNDTITRILFPGSTPQHKIFEGLEKLRHLEFLKHPVCSARSISPSASAITVTRSLSKTRQTKPVDNKQKETKLISKPQAKPVKAKQEKTPPKDIKPKVDTNKLVEEKKEIENGVEEPLKKLDNRILSKDEQIENIKKEIQKIEQAENEEQKKKIVHRSKYDMRNVKSKVDSRAPSKSIDRKKVPEKKAEGESTPPGTPKKGLTNGTATKSEKAKIPAKPIKSTSPLSTPAKSAKEANNRKVVEARVISRSSSKSATRKKEETPPPSAPSAPSAVAKTERKPISRRPKAPSSPVKAGKTAKPEADSTLKKVIKKPGVEAVAIKAAGQIISKELQKGAETEKTETKEKDDIKIEIKKLEDERTENKETEPQAVKNQLESAQSQESTKSKEGEEEVEEEEEYLIVTKEESSEESIKDNESVQEEIQTKDETEGEGEIKKLLREEEESEKKREALVNEEQEVEEELKETKVDDENEQLEEPKEEENEQILEKKEKEVEEVEEKVEEKEIIEDETKVNVEEEKGPEEEKSPEPKEFEARKPTDVDEGIDLKEPALASKEHKEGESLPEEKISNTMETSATTAPTLPEDERVEERVEEEKEVVQEEPQEVVEEKYIQETTKEEKQLEEAPVEMKQPNILTNADVEGIVAPIPIAQKKHPRDVVKTPDEVADLPVHEEVDPRLYSSGEFSKDLQRKPEDDKSPDEKESPTKPDFKAMIKGEANLLDEDGSEEVEQKKTEEEKGDEKHEVKEVENSITSKYLNIIDELEKSVGDGKKDLTEEKEIIKDLEGKENIPDTLKSETLQKQDEKEKIIEPCETKENQEKHEKEGEIQEQTPEAEEKLKTGTDDSKEVTADLAKNISGKSTPQNLDKITSGVFPAVDTPKENSGKSTPQEFGKDEPDKTVLDFAKEDSRQSTPHDFTKEEPDKTVLDSTKEDSQKNTQEDFTKEEPDKATLLDSTKEIFEESTPQDSGKENFEKNDFESSSKDVCGKSTPESVGKASSRKSTPEVTEIRKSLTEEEKEVSGKSTPQDSRKENQEKNDFEDSSKEVCGKSTPESFGKESSRKSTPEVTDIRKSLTEEEKEKVLPESTSGKITPQDLEKDLKPETDSGKIILQNLEEIKAESTSPHELSKLESGKSTPLDIGKDDSGKSTPKDLEKDEKTETKQSVPEDIPKESSGKSSPQTDSVLEKPEPQDVEKEISGKSTPLNIINDTSGKSTPQDLGTEKIISRDFPQDASGKSTPQSILEESLNIPKLQDLDKQSCGKSTPDASGKSTPLDLDKEIITDGNLDESGHIITKVLTKEDRSISPQVEKDTRISTPQDLDKAISGKSTPQDSGKETIVGEAQEDNTHLEKDQEIERTSSDVKSEVRKLSGKSTPEELRKLSSGKESPVDETKQETTISPSKVLEKTLPDESIPEIEVEKSEPPVASGKTTPQESLKDTSGKSTPLEFNSDVKEKVLAEELRKDDSSRSSPHELKKSLSGVSTPTDLNQDKSGKSSPQQLVEDSEKVSSNQNEIILTQESQILKEKESLEIQNDISTELDQIKKLSGKSTPEDSDKNISGKITPQKPEVDTSGKTTPYELENEVADKTTTQEKGSHLETEHFPSGRSTPSEKLKSGKVTPQETETNVVQDTLELEKQDPEKILIKQTEKSASGKSTPLSLEKPVSGLNTPSEKDKLSSGKTSPAESVHLSRSSTPLDKKDFDKHLPDRTELESDAQDIIKSGKISPSRQDNFESEKEKSSDIDRLDTSRRTSQDRGKDLSGKATPCDTEEGSSAKTSRRESFVEPSDISSQFKSEKERVSPEDIKKLAIDNKVPKESLHKVDVDIVETDDARGLDNKESYSTKESTEKDDSKPASENLKLEEQNIEDTEVSEKTTTSEKKILPKESSVSDSVSSGPVEKDISGKSTPFSEDKETSGKISPGLGAKVTSDSVSLALAEKGTSGTYSLEKESADKVSSPSPVDISPISLDELKDSAEKEIKKESESCKSFVEPQSQVKKISESLSSTPSKSPLGRIKYEQRGSSGTSSPDKSYQEKSEGSLQNGVESEEELEKGTLESERQEKESQILDLSSGEEEELKGLGEDEEDVDSEPEFRKERFEIQEGSTSATPETRKEIAKGEKDDINKLVKTGEKDSDPDKSPGVKRMLITASSEDGGTETEISLQGGVKTIKAEKTASEADNKDKNEDDEEGDFSNLILQARKEYEQRSRKTSCNTSTEELEEGEEVESIAGDRQEDVDEDEGEELGNLVMQARQELAFVRSKSRELRDIDSPKPDIRQYLTTKTTTTSETTRMDDNDLITITTILTEEREEQEDGSFKVTKTTETHTTGGREEGTVVTVSTNFESKEDKKTNEKEEETSSSQVNSGSGEIGGDRRSGSGDGKRGSKEDAEGKVSIEEITETSRRTSASSIISQEDLVSRKDSAKIEDFRQSSSEMSPLKTTYITSHGDSESLMTSSFYGNLPTEDEMIERAEHTREFRKGKGYESVTEIGPNGERTERTYFYGTDDEDSIRTMREKSRFVKAYYTEDGNQRDGDQSRYVHRYYTSDIPEEEGIVEQTRFVQRFYAEQSSHPEAERFHVVKTESGEGSSGHMDFAKAIDEHMSARGEYLGKEFQQDLAKYTNGRSKVETSSEELKEEEKKEKESEGKEENGSKKKDIIEDWGKPLGLPLPPKNMNKTYAFPGQNISTTSSLSTPTDNSDSVTNWGQPMSLPSPAPPLTQNGVAETLPAKAETPGKETPKKEKKPIPKKNINENSKGSGNNTPNRRSESPIKQTERRAPSTGRSKAGPSSHLYLDLTYVPHHGNSYYSNVEFFKKVRARYYVFSGTEPSKEVYNALLEAKQTWEDKKLEVTIIPTYDTDVLGYWVAENEEILAKNKIDLSPSASRCTINLQDHETSCSAYRLEF